jgi:copper chaperone CopZ
MDTTVFKAAGISCPGSVDSVMIEPDGISGVGKVEASLARGEASVADDSAKAEPTGFGKAVEDTQLDTQFEAA